MSRKRVYVAEWTVRGTQIAFVHNAKSAKDAKAKLVADSSDVEYVDHEITESFRRSAKVRLDRVR